jgi:hypothetical protein
VKETLKDLIKSAPSGQDIYDTGVEIIELLLRKNISYGDSALNPRPIFSKADNSESLASRIDDKLNRIANGTNYPGDNDIDDLLGYLILFKIRQRRNAAAKLDKSAV